MVFYIVFVTLLFLCVTEEILLKRPSRPFLLVYSLLRKDSQNLEPSEASDVAS